MGLRPIGVSSRGTGPKAQSRHDLTGRRPVGSCSRTSGLRPLVRREAPLGAEPRAGPFGPSPSQNKILQLLGSSGLEWPLEPYYLRAGRRPAPIDPL